MGLSYQVAPLLRCREVSRSPAFLSEFVTVSDSAHEAGEEGDAGIRGWDKKEWREGNGCRILKRTQSNSSGAETTFGDSRDDPRVAVLAGRGRVKEWFLQSLV